MILRTILIVGRYGEEVLRHGTVGLLLNSGDAGNSSDSFGRAVDRIGRPQTDIAVLRQPPDPPAEIRGFVLWDGSVAWTLFSLFCGF